MPIDRATLKAVVVLLMLTGAIGYEAVRVTRDRQKGK